MQKTAQTFNTFFRNIQKHCILRKMEYNTRNRADSLIPAIKKNTASILKYKD